MTVLPFLLGRRADQNVEVIRSSRLPPKLRAFFNINTILKLAETLV